MYFLIIVPLNTPMSTLLYQPERQFISRHAAPVLSDRVYSRINHPTYSGKKPSPIRMSWLFGLCWA